MERIKAALRKTFRRPNQAESSLNRVDGPHWRRSVNKALQYHVGPGGLQRSSPRTPSTMNNSTSSFLALPRELWQLIEDYLTRVDAVCLRQTCQKARSESKAPFEAKGLNSRQLYSLRRRLDRDGFSILCTLESNPKLNTELAACSFCLKLHEPKWFSTNPLRSRPEERECRAVSWVYSICGRYWTHPAVLRLALDEVLATGREEFRMHHWMPAPASTGGAHIVLSRAIELNTRLPERLASLYVDDTGLVVEHHFHIHSQPTLQPIDWSLATARMTAQKGLLPICLHITLHSAGTVIAHSRELSGDQRWLKCQASNCRTEFASFEGPANAVGWKDHYVRVRRRFGWMEDLTESCWGSV